MDSEDDIQPLIGSTSDDGLWASLDSSLQSIKLDPEYEQVVYGYLRSRWRTAIVNIFSILFLGIPCLVFHWCPTWYLYATSVRCSFQIADQVLIVETFQKKWKSFFIHKIQEKNISDISGLINQGFQPDIENNSLKYTEKSDDLSISIPLEDGSVLNEPCYRYFWHKKQTLVWDAMRARWARLGGAEAGVTCAALHARAARPPCAARRARMLNVYGLNEIVVPVQSAAALALLEVFNPFYVFQLFTICVWLAERYYYYCVAVVIMSAFGVVTSVIQTKRNQENLRATVEAHETVQVWSGGGDGGGGGGGAGEGVSVGVGVDSREVAPGDVVLLPPQGCTLHFDAVLLCGSAILNESMLTGESVPVTKTALLRSEQPFDMKEHSASVLFSGTAVIQTRYYNREPVRALVLRTGYSTSKGQLVRSILYPVPADFKFDRDSYRFIAVLAAIAALGLAYSVALKVYRGLSVGMVVVNSLDIITIVVPAALPAAVTVGRLYAVARLRRAGVACMNTRAVNVSGSLDCICFDKTGTLTEDGLDMWGVVPAGGGGSGAGAGDERRLARPVRRPAALSDLQPLKLGMAACHSLTLLNGQLAGDPLDLKMFESTGWTLEEPDVPEQCNYELLMPTILRPSKPTTVNIDDVNMPLEVGVVQQYQFSSALQRASVAVRVLGEGVLRVFCKGAPETLRTLCVPGTVPEDLSATLSSHAARGYRVIAMGTRLLRASVPQLRAMTRDEVECELEFLGLIVMENRLKPVATSVIRELKEADIHVVMITGDNVHTAVSVARECGILARGERVVTLTAEEGSTLRPVRCEVTDNGVPVGKPTLLPRDWPSDDSGRGSWAGAGSGVPGGSGGSDTEAPRGEPNYKIVMTGDTWRVVREQYPRVVGCVVERGAVFARMTADQKQQLVLAYQALGYCVGMCGDGANDCGALRAAHAGIALAASESSVAAAFSARGDLLAVGRVLRQGRAALATAFGVFKFMVAYSLTEFVSVAALYYYDSNLTDFQFLYIDVALIVNFAFFFGMTEAHEGRLCRVPPLSSLLGVEPLASLAGQLLLVAATQGLSLYAVSSFPWYVRHEYDYAEDYQCWENYAVFCVSMFQYIILAVAFSHGAPYRKSVLTNRKLMASVLVMAAVSIYITVRPAQWLARFLQLEMPLDILMSYIVLALAAFNLVLALFFERVIVEYCMERKQMIPRCLKERRVRKTPHLMLKRQLRNTDYLDGGLAVHYESETSGVLTDSKQDSSS